MSRTGNIAKGALLINLFLLILPLAILPLGEASGYLRAMSKPLLWIVLACAIAGSAHVAVAVEGDWTLADVRQGASEMSTLLDRRLDYATTYRFARGMLEKRVHTGNDTPGFRLAVHLILTHWLARLPTDTAWRLKALARHRDVTAWTARESPLPLADVAHAAALGRGLPKSEEPWLTSVLKGEPEAALPRQETPTPDQ